MKDGLGEVQVAKMTGALGHVSCASLTTRGSVHGALPRVHEATQLGPTSFVCLRVSKCKLL